MRINYFSSLCVLVSCLSSPKTEPDFIPQFEGLTLQEYSTTYNGGKGAVFYLFGHDFSLRDSCSEQIYDSVETLQREYEKRYAHNPSSSERLNTVYFAYFTIDHDALSLEHLSSRYNGIDSHTTLSSLRLLGWEESKEQRISRNLESEEENEEKAYYAIANPTISVADWRAFETPEPVYAVVLDDSLQDAVIEHVSQLERHHPSFFYVCEKE